MHIRDAIADHERVRQIIFVFIEVCGEHPGAGLSCRRLFMRKGRIDMNCRKSDALPFQCPHDEIMHRLKFIAGEGFRTQSVLVRHHHEFIIRLLRNAVQVAEHARIESNFLKSVELVGGRGLLYQGAVAVYEEDPFHVVGCCLAPGRTFIFIFSRPCRMVGFRQIYSSSSECVQRFEQDFILRRGTHRDADAICASGGGAPVTDHDTLRQ